jgi:hypothetical protein
MAGLMQAVQEQGQLKAEEGKNWRVPIRQVSGYPSDTLVGTHQSLSRVPTRMPDGYPPVLALGSYKFHWSMPSGMVIMITQRYAGPEIGVASA